MRYDTLIYDTRNYKLLHKDFVPIILINGVHRLREIQRFYWTVAAQ